MKQTEPNNQDFVKEANRTSLLFYSDKNNVSRKYISQYGSLSKSGDYFCNKNCLTEVFNMLDIVAQLKLEEYQDQSVPLPDKMIHGRENVGYLYQGKRIYYWRPNGFRNRIVALRKYGCHIPESIDDVVRVTRNFTTHGNVTVVLDVRPLGYEYTRELMLIMADALIELGFLDPEDRIPSFEKMRAHPGDSLQSGKYLVGPQIMDSPLLRIYKGTQKTLGRKLAIAELKPDMVKSDVLEDESLFLAHIRNSSVRHVYDVFSEHGTWYVVMEYQETVDLVEENLRNKHSGFSLDKVVAKAAVDLKLSSKGQESFRTRVERRYFRETGYELEEADSAGQLDRALLKRIIQDVYQEYVSWAEAHHISVRKGT